MNIRKINIQELRTMHDKEALILRGCGGDLQEWVDGISEELRKEKILKGEFQNCTTFKDGNSTCLIFPFEGAELDVGKLAMWRIRTVGAYGGTWLSDFVDNRLGGFSETPQKQKKPDCPLIGQNGNTINLLGIASRTLKQHGMRQEAEEMQKRVLSSQSYAEALYVIGEYVNITSINDVSGDEEESEDMNMGVS